MTNNLFFFWGFVTFGLGGGRVRVGLLIKLQNSSVE